MSDSALVPEVEVVETPADFDRIVERVKGLIGSLRPLNYDKSHEEAAELNVVLPANPTLQQLYHNLSVIQGMKDRVASLAMDALHHHQMYDMVTTLLVDGWQKFSRESSADKRKAEAGLKMSQFIAVASRAETLHKALLRVMENLNSKQESISRQITCFNLMLKLNDASRATPDASLIAKDTTFDRWMESDLTPDNTEKYDGLVK